MSEVLVGLLGTVGVALQGGVSACKARGSSIEADCIDGKDYAAIFYLRNGVCHQIANRILSAANIFIPAKIAQIRGTYALYGPFGYNLPGQAPPDCWPERQVKCATPPSSGGPSGSGGPSSKPTSSSTRPPDSSTTQYSIGSTGLTKSATKGKFDPPDQRSTLSYLIREGLGHPVKDEVFEGLADMQSRLQARQRELAQLVMAEKISREKYVAELDGALKEASQIGEKLLGFDDFHKVFGEFRVQSMGDVKAFIGSGGAIAR